jgi:hypothetical protein
LPHLGHSMAIAMGSSWEVGQREAARHRVSSAAQCKPPRLQEQKVAIDFFRE